LKRLIVLLVAALAATAVTANVAQAADPTVVCLNNATATLAVQVPYQGGSARLTDGGLAFIEANAATAPGGLFYAGFVDFGVVSGSFLFVPEVLGETPEGIFDPGYSTNHVTRGGCFVVQERTYVTCYGNFPDSMRYVGGDEARAMLKEGTFRNPLASTSQVTSFKVGAHYLTCNAGSQKPTGRFVSTGNAGEVVAVDSVGAGLVRSNPLDYTMEVS
jgi:hypothetical protein